jgi:hypothetical protein
LRSLVCFVFKKLRAVLIPGRYVFHGGNGGRAGDESIYGLIYRVAACRDEGEAQVGGRTLPGSLEQEAFRSGIYLVV